MTEYANIQGYCFCCDRKLVPIKKDHTGWGRKYHKSCWQKSTLNIAMLDRPGVVMSHKAKKLCCYL